MAGILFDGRSTPAVLVSNTAQTLLQIQAPANQRVIVRNIRASGLDASGSANLPVRYRITRSTSNFGTSSTATPSKRNPSDAEAIQSTCKQTFTVEPTSPTEDGAIYISPQLAFGEQGQWEIPGGQSLQVEALCPSGTPTVECWITAEE